MAINSHSASKRPFNRGVRVALALVAILIGAPSLASSSDAQGILAEYTRTSWGLGEGAPDGSVYALAQDHDGRLWLGTQAGLYQFDGERFLSWAALGFDAALGEAVQALYVSRDDSLWVGFGDKGGIYRITGHTVRRFPPTDGAPSLAVYAIAEDIGGRVWVGSEAGLYSFQDERWQRWRAESGLPDASVWGAHVDAVGELFVTTARGIFRYSEHSGRFASVAPLGDSGTRPIERAAPEFASPRGNGLPWTPRLPSDEVVRSIVTDQSRRLYVSDWHFGFRMIGDRRPLSSRDRGRGLQVLVDHQGSLWVATLGQGVWRSRQGKPGAPVTERITSHDGLASDGAFALLEDRDGSIWVGGTPNGLTRLTPNRFRPLLHDDVVTALAVMPTGGVWVGTSDALWQVSAPDAHPTIERRLMTSVSIRALHVDIHGTLWVATQRNLLRMAPGQPPALVRGSEVLQQVDTMTSDPRRGLFVSDRDRGLLHWDGSGSFQNVALPASLRGSRITTSFADSRARIWVAFASGSVAMLGQDGYIKTFDAHDGFDAGIYRTIHEDQQGVLWFGGTNGITRFEHDAGATVRDSHRLPMRHVKAIADDRFGFLWIAVDYGILRIDRAELNKAAPNASVWPGYVLYDKSDGLAGLPRLVSDAMSIRTHGGSLWFVTDEGITIVDPTLYQHDVSPSVRIDRALADDREIALVPNAQMPAGTRRVQFEYGALNLASARKTRYRFRLEGLDSDWVNAGGRRQATYMNLAPGTYRFQVAATSSLGAWKDLGSSWDFSVKPHFYQTTWFFASCGMLIVLGASLAWRVRLRIERNRFSVLLKERARVSREIHDTLLQGLVGLTLQCDTLARDVEAAAPEVSDRLLAVRRQGQRYIKDSRQAIWNLRFASADRETLVGALRRVADVTAGAEVAFDVLLKGSPRELASDTEQELVRIAREAVTNAVRHAKARRINVEVEYSPTQLVLRVLDDGCGFVDGEIVGAPEHFGIVSMRERAKTIGAAFNLETGVGRGTAIEVIVASHHDAPRAVAAI